MNLPTPPRVRSGHPARAQASFRRYAFAILLTLALAPAALAADGGASLAGVLNVNTASVEELTLLPGVGDSRARAIVALREERGGFKHVDELLDVKGIGDKALGKLRPFLAVKGSSTLTLR